MGDPDSRPKLNSSDSPDEDSMDHSDSHLNLIEYVFADELTNDEQAESAVLIQEQEVCIISANLTSNKLVEIIYLRTILATKSWINC